jgi:outer membrane protein TolC
VGQSRDQIELARLSTAETRQAIAVATANAYISVMAARRQVEVSQRALESARAHLDFAQKRLEGGAGSRLNQARAAQAVSRDEAQLENTTFALLVAQEALGVLMGEDGPIDAASEPVFDDPVAVTGDEWLAQRPDIQFETRNIEAADRVVRDTWRAWLPTASLSFTPQAVTPGSLFSNSRSWQLGVGIQQRVFDRRPAAAKALRQVALSQARFARDDVELRARSEVRQARQSVVLLERALLSSRRAAEQAAEVLRISTSAFELGATTNLEVIDAQQTAQDADSSVSLAEYALRRARLNLLVALGQFK